MATQSRGKLRIFISHSHSDGQLGIRLYEDLQNVLEKKRGDVIWYDTRGLKLGDHWRKMIDRQLERSNVFILLFSRAAKKSGWVDYELDAAIDRTVGGKGKIFVICCDDCPPPKNLYMRYQSIKYTSLNDYKFILNKIICDLGLKAEPDDLKEATTQQLMRQMELAFESKDWADVIRRADFLIERFPDIPLFSIYGMKGLALFELERVPQSVDTLNKALSCAVDDERYLNLLEQYTNLLIDKKYWQGVKIYSTRALEIVPNADKWLKMQEQAYLNLGLNRQSEHTSTEGSNSVVEAIDEELATNDTTANTENFVQETSYHDTDSDINVPFSSNVNSLDGFTQKVIPHHYIKQMFHSKLSLSSFLIDIIISPIILSSWAHQLVPIITLLIILCFISFILLCLFVWGWLTEHDWIALVLSLVFAIAWGLSSSYASYYVVSQLNGFNQILNILVYAPFVIGMIFCCISWYCHHELFRGKN